MLFVFANPVAILLAFMLGMLVTAGPLGRMLYVLGCWTLRLALTISTAKGDDGLRAALGEQWRLSRFLTSGAFRQKLWTFPSSVPSELPYDSRKS